MNSQLCLSFRTLSIESGSAVSNNGYTVTRVLASGLANLYGAPFVNTSLCNVFLFIYINSQKTNNQKLIYKFFCLFINKYHI